MKIILIPGLWLDATAWDAVLQPLRDAGHEPVAVTMPGLDGGSSATLDEQIDAVTTVIDAADEPVYVVGHSASSTLAWLAVDRRADRVAGVAMVGGMPQAEGNGYAPFFQPDGDTVKFPGWEAFVGPDSDDLTQAHREAFAAASHPMPAQLLTAEVHYTDERRYSVPVDMVCPEYSPEQAEAWLEAGEIPELEPVEHLTFVDLDSGHWPMFSKPAQLAALVDELAEGHMAKSRNSSS